MRCVCNSGVANAKHQHEVTHSIRFLTGLNEHFVPVRAQILLMNPLPPLNKIFSMVLQHERQYNLTHVDDSRVLINASDSRKGQGRGRGNGGYSSNSGGNRSNSYSAKGKECSYCGKTNHVVENCYMKHGFPPNYGKNYAANNTSVESSEERDDADDTKSVRGQNNSDTFGFTKEQYNHLVSLLQASGSSNSTSSSKVNIASGHVTSGTTKFACSINSSPLGSWIVDSGASDHICSSMKLFSSYTSIAPIHIRLPNGSTSISRYAGTVEFSPGFLVTQVLFVPDFNLNLLSVPKLCLDNKYNVSFNDFNSACDICHYARHRKSLFTLSSKRANKCYELFHFDIWGLVSVSSVHGHKYFLTALDDYSRFTWIILCKTKSEITTLVQNFITMIEKQFDCHVKTIRTDNGLEFLMPEFYASKGILHQTSCVETPQQNGRVERKHQHILNVGRALLFQSKLPKQFWSYAVLQAVYIINRIPSPLLNNKSPYTLCFHHEPDLNDLKVFGCLCYASTIQSHRTKFDVRARKSVYLGHKQGVKGAVLFDLNTRNIFVSRNVTFHEQILPYQSSNSNFHWQYHSTHDAVTTDSTAEHVIYDDNETTPSTHNNNLPLNTHTDNHNHIDSPPSPSPPHDSCDTPDNHSATPHASTDNFIPRRSTRSTHLPSHLSDYICNLPAVSNQSSSSDGTIERYKARLVAKAMNSWHLHQLDVNNAFLHGDLQEDVYMSIPQGVHHFNPNQVCKLLKSLYGLKQASTKWYEKLTGVLLAQGYHQSVSDHSLFTLKHDNMFTALLVYVDDIILAGNSLDEFQRIKQLLDTQFKIKDLGQLKYFLGIEVAHSKVGITICQRKYCLDLLHDTCLLGAKPAKTPLDNSVKLHQDTTQPYKDIAGYRRLVGKLLYLTTTRPDIAFVTQQLSQFLSSPTQTHYDTACRVVRYLKGSPGRGLLFRRDAQLQLLGFTDADWAGCLDTRRSTSGYCFFLGSSLISWRAKKQHTWLVYLLTDLNVQCVKPPVLYCDNQSALHIAANPVFHERTKHLEIDYHFVREKLQQGVFKLLPIHTKSQLADFFTKALPPKAFLGFISKLNMLDIYHV
ncbi:hypothetical protein P8452_48162 [Trifolium repens]|nr:hypothetical protein P8452_48162 [Trifolium repens]